MDNSVCCVVCVRCLNTLIHNSKTNFTALQRLRKTDDVSDEITSMTGSIQGKCIGTEFIGKPKKRLFWWGMIICMINHISQQFTGINAVSNSF